MSSPTSQRMWRGYGDFGLFMGKPCLQLSNLAETIKQHMLAVSVTLSKIFMTPGKSSIVSGDH